MPRVVPPRSPARAWAWPSFAHRLLPPRVRAPPPAPSPGVSGQIGHSSVLRYAARDAGPREPPWCLASAGRVCRPAPGGSWADRHVSHSPRKGATPSSRPNACGTRPSPSVVTSPSERALSRAARPGRYRVSGRMTSPRGYHIALASPHALRRLPPFRPVRAPFALLAVLRPPG